MASYVVQLLQKYGESFLNYLVYILYSDSVYDSGPISFVCNNIIHSRKVNGGRIKRTRTGRGDFASLPQVSKLIAVDFALVFHLVRPLERLGSRSWGGRSLFPISHL